MHTVISLKFLFTSDDHKSRLKELCGSPETWCMECNRYA